MLVMASTHSWPSFRHARSTSMLALAQNAKAQCGLLRWYRTESKSLATWLTWDLTPTRRAGRPSVTLSMLSYVTAEDPDRRDVELALKREWSDGSKSLIFSQRDLVERLASLVPPPWFNQTRYSGVFAPARAWRDFIVPGPKRLNMSFQTMTIIEMK